MGFDAVRLGRDDCDEEDPGPGEEAGAVEALPHWKVAAFFRVSIEEELRGGVPEDLVGRKLEEDFRVCGHGEGGDALLFPGREGRREGDGVVLENAEAMEISTFVFLYKS